MRLSIIFIALIISTFHTYAQNEFTITGDIIDKNTNKPLPFATISDQNKSLGTASDINGHFIFSVQNITGSDSIIISYIGYEPIKTIISACLNTTTFKLEQHPTPIKEVVVSSEKFKLKPFMREVIADYNRDKRDSPHIAIAHYYEKAKKNNKYIMYMESIGYSVFEGKLQNATPLSNYKFFCENTKCAVLNQDWVEYKANGVGNDNLTVLPSGGANLNAFRYLEIKGLLSERYSKNYTFEIDSSYVLNENQVYCIHFEGDIASGSIHVFAANKHILKIDCNTHKYWSNALFDRVSAHLDIHFNYYNNAPFIASIQADYNHEKLEYENYLEILVQKFNEFELEKDQYWGINTYDHNPYIEYTPQEWTNFNLKTDEEYNSIKEDLKTADNDLESQFKNYSNRWFFSGIEHSDVAASTIKELKQNF